MTRREWKSIQKAIWRSTQGCTCRALVRVDGKLVRTRADERCTTRWVRCNGRYRRIFKEMARLGPEPEARTTQARSRSGQGT